ncbi:MAG: SMP-30/gluconolactonase/LRE family protein [Reyranella sp.]|nr:PQQ-binding-like beta-propeller repeat protein [Reyranella sp.]MDO8972845.1 SMP-30/gluconolactonase/LRE family protein [Reyranella sp.]MDP3241592.1 SMP-30/gluconolactonase/LRE family protein [Reyranella sp.]
MGLGRIVASAVLAFGVTSGAWAQQAEAPPPREYSQQFLVPGSWFHGVHGLAFNKDDQLFAGSVIGQTLYRVQVDSGEVDRVIDPPTGMADDIAFADDGTMAWTAFLIGKVYVRKPNGKTIEVANGMTGPNSLAFGKDGRLFVSEVFLGDALYEIDIRNVDKPDFKPLARNELRRIAEKLGGLNGFEVHKDDGFLYGPLWFKGEIVKVNLETGAAEVIASGFKTPAAANIDPQNRDNVYVVDTGTGGIWSVSLTSKAKKLVASMKPGLDNLAFDSRGRLFVTSMTDNGVYLVDKHTGAHRTIVEGKLAVPTDLAVTSEGGKDTVHVADVFSYRKVDGTTGDVTDVLRVHGETHAYPIGISVGPKNVLLSSWFSNTVEKVDRKTGKLVATLGEFAAPVDAVEFADGTMYVAELASGNLVKVSADGKERSTVMKELRGPVAMVHGAGPLIYVTEISAGVVTEIDVAAGTRRVVADNLTGPEGIDLGPDGRLYVAEVGQKRVVAIDPATGAKTVIASNLDIGLAPFPGGPPALVPTGVAVGRTGIVYVSSDIRNSLYKLTPP